MSRGAVSRRAITHSLPLDRLLTVVTVGVAAVAVYQLVLAVWMTASPHSFFKQLGPFGLYNRHYIRDLATYNAAIGVTLALAIKRRSWRVPLLALCTLQFGLHSVNHIVDVNAAHPAWVGYLDVVTLVVSAAVLYWLTRAAMAVAAQEAPEFTSVDS